jgi:hypothetical protein
MFVPHENCLNVKKVRFPRSLLGFEVKMLTRNDFKTLLRATGQKMAAVFGTLCSTTTSNNQ